MHTSMTLDEAQQVLWALSDDTDPQMVKQAIQMGADVNALEPETGRSPLMVFCEEVMKYRPETSAILDALLVAGAHPLTGDCALHRAISSDSAWMVEQIVTRALTDDLRGDFGETVFHVFAQMVREGEHCTMAGDAFRKAIDLGKVEVVSLADQRGNTPLHTLWIEGFALEMLDCGDLDLESDNVEAQWYMTNEFWKQGCAIDVKNEKGQTVIDLIEKARSEGFLEAERDDNHAPFHEAVRVCQTHAQLDEKTVPAKGRGRSRRV